MVDDFALWIPAAEESQSEPRMMAAASAENLYWDFDGQNYAGWYSGLPGQTSYWATTSPFYRSGYPGCQHVTIRTTSTGYEGLAGRGSWFGGWTSECPSGWALNGVIDLGQSYLVTNVTYARYTKFEGLGRTYGIVLRNENFQAVPGPVWYTIAGTNYATHSHNLSTPSYVRYIQVLGNTSGSYNVIFDWVQLNYTPPTPTPSPTPTATPTHMPASARCPTITADDATYFAGPDLSTMPVNVLISGTGIDLMGIYINGGWYAIRRYSSPEGGAMAAQGMRASAIETEAIEGWIQADDVVLTGEDGLPLPCLVDIPEVDENGNIVEGTPTATAWPTNTPSPTPQDSCYATVIVPLRPFRSRPDLSDPENPIGDSSRLFSVDNAMTVQDPQTGSRFTSGTIRLLVNQWLGSQEERRTNGNYETVTWLGVTAISTLNEEVRQQGYIALRTSAAEEDLLSLSCDENSLPGHPLPTPTPGPTPTPVPFGERFYIACSDINNGSSCNCVSVRIREFQEVSPYYTS